MVTDPALRDTLLKVGDDPAEEMAAITWPYAAAMAIRVPVCTLFHTVYKGGPDCLIGAFARVQLYQACEWRARWDRRRRACCRYAASCSPRWEWPVPTGA